MHLFEFREKAQREERERMFGDRPKSSRGVTAVWRIGPLVKSAKSGNREIESEPEHRRRPRTTNDAADDDKNKTREKRVRIDPKSA